MPFLDSLPADAGPPAIFAKYPDIYRAWSEMSEALMNGPSALSQADRETLLAYAAGVTGCDFVCVAHSEVAYARGVARGLVDQLLEDVESAPVDARLRPLLVFVRKLALTPGEISQPDVDRVLEAGWDEQALHDAIAITGRAAFMQRLIQGFGFAVPSREAAAKHAHKRVAHGYVNLYRAFRENK